MELKLREPIRFEKKTLGDDGRRDSAALDISRYVSSEASRKRQDYGYVKLECWSTM